MRWLSTWLMLCGVSFGQVQFDGVNDYINMGNVDINTNEFTVCAWVRPNWRVDTFEYFIAKYNLVLNQRMFGAWITTDNKFRYFVSNNNSGTVKLDYTTVDSYNDGNTHFFAMVFDRGSSKLYIDGSIANVVTNQEDTFTHANSCSVDVYVGWFRYVENVYYQFDGIVHDARIYNRALSASEIRTIYETPWALAVDPALVLRTCINSGDTGSTLTGTCRNYGTGADGTYSNSPTVAPGKIQTVKPFEEDNP